MKELYNKIDDKITKDFHIYRQKRYAGSVESVLRYLLENNQEKQLQGILSKNIFPKLCKELEEDYDVCDLILSKVINLIETELGVEFDD